MSPRGQSHGSTAEVAMGWKGDPLQSVYEPDPIEAESEPPVAIHEWTRVAITRLGYDFTEPDAGVEAFIGAPEWWEQWQERLSRRPGTATDEMFAPFADIAVEETAASDAILAENWPPD